MAEIGPTLREARMRAGLDISQIEAATKIRAKYLRALENEEWGLLPGSAFTRGFLRSYAEMVGLDWRLLVEEYRREWEEPNELDLAPVRPTIGFGAGEADDAPRRWLPRPRVIVVALLACVLLVAIVELMNDSSGSPGAGASAPPNGGLASTTAQGSATTPTGATAPSCVASVSGALPAGCVALRVEPTAPVSVCLIGDAGAVRIDNQMLSPFAARSPTYHARRFVITLSNTSAHLVIDGRALDIPPLSGGVRYRVTAGATVKVKAPVHPTCS
jgi:hypothetical protein